MKTIFRFLSAAFDTIDHDILLERFGAHYGIKGAALKIIAIAIVDLGVVGGVPSLARVLREMCRSWPRCGRRCAIVSQDVAGDVPLYCMRQASNMFNLHVDSFENNISSN